MIKRNRGIDFFERHFSLNGGIISSQEEKRIQEMLSLIPKDCSSILDVGCGDGRITNHLVNKYEYVCGLDNSEEALKHIISEKKLSSLDSLPFADKSFDLILCSEVLEHLGFQIYSQSLKEIERVAKKYILITVPNNQNRKLSSVICPYCGCIFDPSWHLSSFNLKKMQHLFVQFKPKLIKPFALTKTYPGFIFEIRRLLNPIFKIPFPDNTLCPQCGYFNLSDNKIPLNDSYQNKKPLIQVSRLIIKVIPKKEKGIWLMALYERS